MGPHFDAFLEATGTSSPMVGNLAENSHQESPLAFSHCHIDDFRGSLAAFAASDRTRVTL